MSARATGGPKSVELEALLRDLGDETGYLMGLLLALPTPAWDTPTPAEGWTVRDQVSHLAFSDNAAHHAITDERRFEQLRAEALLDLAEFIERANIPGRRLPGNELLGQFLRARMELIESLRSVAPQVRIPWFGPAMSVASFATARLMETWAHGQDIIDALGLSPVATDRLRHIADLGVRTLPNSFRVRGRPVPTAPVRVELTGPHERGYGVGAHRRRRTTSPARRSTSVSSLRSDAISSTHAWPWWATWRRNGWQLPKPSPAHRGRVDVPASFQSENG